MSSMFPVEVAESGKVDVFAYSGAVSDKVIAATGESLRARLATLGVKSPQARKVFSSFVELAYNIVHHGVAEGVRDVKIVRCGSLAVWREAEDFHLLARSLVASDSAPALAARLDDLRRLSPAEVGVKFRSRLSSLKEDDDGAIGAGLGLLTIARNASQPIEYLLNPVQSEAAMLELQIHTAIH